MVRAIPNEVMAVSWAQASGVNMLWGVGTLMLGGTVWSSASSSHQIWFSFFIPNPSAHKQTQCAQRTDRGPRPGQARKPVC